MTIPARFWMPENPQGKPYVTSGPLAAPPYVECVRVDSLDGWRDIESAPKDGTVIYVWLNVTLNKYAAFDFNMKLAQWLVDASEWRIEGVGGNVPQNPTHWMPLPAPPT